MLQVRKQGIRFNKVKIVQTRGKGLCLWELPTIPGGLALRSEQGWWSLRVVSEIVA
jgi:hypothetical protein